MTTSETTVQALVGLQLNRLADVLRTVPEVAESPSLCSGWTVRHVLAHMTMAARYDGPAFHAELEAAGYDFDTLSEAVARRDAALPFHRLLDDLSGNALATWAPPIGGAMGALTHAVVHGLDITEAVGLDRTCTDDACRLVLEFLTDVSERPFQVDTSGRSLRATDLAWQHGTGESLRASAADLILVLSGRPRPTVDLRDPRT